MALTPELLARDSQGPPLVTPAMGGGVTFRSELRGPKQKETGEKAYSHRGPGQYTCAYHEGR